MIAQGRCRLILVFLLTGVAGCGRSEVSIPEEPEVPEVERVALNVGAYGRDFLSAPGGSTLNMFVRHLEHTMPQLQPGHAYERTFQEMYQISHTLMNEYGDGPYPQERVTRLGQLMEALEQ